MNLMKGIYYDLLNPFRVLCRFFLCAWVSPMVIQIKPLRALTMHKQCHLKLESCAEIKSFNLLAYQYLQNFYTLNL